MNMKTKLLRNILLLAAVVLLSAGVSACTKLNAGESFTSTFNGVEYKFTVIVTYGLLP